MGNVSGGEFKAKALAGEVDEIDKYLSSGDESLLSWTDADGKTVLQCVAEAGITESVQSILDAGADVNYVESKQLESALILAAKKNRFDVVDLLLKNGANPNLQVSCCIFLFSVY